MTRSRSARSTAATSTPRSPRRAASSPYSCVGSVTALLVSQGSGGGAGGETRRPQEAGVGLLGRGAVGRRLMGGGLGGGGGDRPHVVKRAELARRAELDEDVAERRRLDRADEHLTAGEVGGEPVEEPVLRAAA